MLHSYMIVDDDPTNNLICKMVIKRYDSNANVSVFQDPEAALEYIISEERPTTKTILLLDVNMPAMTGWEFLDVFRTFSQEITDIYEIYILTSAIHDFSEEENNYPMVSNILSKPLRSNVLEEINP